MSTIVITGGGRGVGLELVRQLGDMPASLVSSILVTTRGSPPQQLKELISQSAGRILHIQCEITKEGSVRQAAAEIESKLAPNGLDILINNVGVMPITEAGLGALREDELLTAFDVNVVSTHRFTAALIPVLRKGIQKKVIMISTPLGSINYAARYIWHPTPAYKITKAALNMLSVQYAIEYGKEGFTFLAVAPGWLRTDMGSQDADLDVGTGVNALRDLILEAGTEKNGKFYNIRVPGWEHAEGPNQYDGAEIPW